MDTEGVEYHRRIPTGTGGGPDCDGSKTPIAIEVGDSTDYASLGRNGRMSKRLSITERDAGKAYVDQRRRIALTVGLCCNVLFIFLGFKVLVPFFTGEVLDIFPKRPGRSRHWVIGIILSLSIFVETAAAFVYSYEIYNTSANYVVILSAATFVVATMLFSLVNRIRPWSVFVGMCVSLQVVLGTCMGYNVPAAYATLFRLFPGSTGTMAGLTRSMSSFGFLAGPALGGVLYDAGGFALPFLVAGGLVGVVTIGNVLLMICLPVRDNKLSQSPERIGRVSYLHILCIPRVWALLWVYGLTFCFSGYLDVTTAHRVKTMFHTSSGVGGATNVVYALVSSVLSLVNGYIMDHHVQPDRMLFLGSSGAVVGMLLYGPASIVPISPSLEYHFFSVIPMAVAFAGLAPAIPILLFRTLDSNQVGNVNEVSSHVVSILYIVSAGGYGVGFLLGPPAAQYVGLRGTSSLFTIAALSVLATSLALNATSSLQSGRAFLKHGTLPGGCRDSDLVALNLLSGLI